MAENLAGSVRSGFISALRARNEGHSYPKRGLVRLSILEMMASPNASFSQHNPSSATRWSSINGSVKRMFAR